MKKGDKVLVLATLMNEPTGLANVELPKGKTFPPTVQEIIAEMYKRFGHRLSAQAIDEFARDFGSTGLANVELGNDIETSTVAVPVEEVILLSDLKAFMGMATWLRDMTQSALAHVSHGGPSRAEAEKAIADYDVAAEKLKGLLL